MTYLNLEQLGEVHEGLDLVLEDADLAVVHEVHQIGELREPHPGRHDEHRVLARVALQQGPFEGRNLSGEVMSAEMTLEWKLKLKNFALPGLCMALEHIHK